MSSWVYNAMIGLVNQHQVWVRNYAGKTDNEENTNGQGEKDVKVKVQGGSTGAVYGLGIIGAGIFYLGRAATPREKGLGLLKAFVWPVFFVRQSLEFLNKE